MLKGGTCIDSTLYGGEYNLHFAHDHVLIKNRRYIGKLEVNGFKITFENDAWNIEKQATITVNPGLKTGALSSDEAMAKFRSQRRN